MVHGAGCALVLLAQGEGVSPDPRSEATREMAAILERMAVLAPPDRVKFLSRERAVMYERQLQRVVGTPREIEARFKLLDERINANQNREALADLDAIDALHHPKCPKRDCAIDARVLGFRALAWQRIGEIENCIESHGCESCILPIAHGATHLKREGSENASALLREMLRRDPKDFDARWRLNVVEMTLGGWPEKVPPEFLVPPERFASDHDIGRFRECASECGVAPVTLSGGVVAEDFDGDGLDDLLCSSIGMRDRMWLYRNRGDGTFEERAFAAGLEGIVGGLNMTHADYDNDGDADVFVLRGAWFGDEGALPNSLLRNDGKGNFEDVTKAAGVLSFHPTQAGRFADFDGDGWLDLAIGNESGVRTVEHGCELYLNQRDGTFRDVADEVGFNYQRFVKALAIGDYDNDGREDVYLSCRKDWNLLLRNEPADTPAGFRFRDVTQEAGVEQPKMSFPTFFFDYDNDGWLDLWVGAQSGFNNDRTDEIYRLCMGQRIDSEVGRCYRNLGNGKFEEVGAQLGVARVIFAMAANFGDLDDDGWPDFYVGTGSPDLRALLPNRMFRNDGGRRFQDVTTSGGFGHLQKGHAIAFADLDRDGDQDVYAVMGGATTGDVYPNVLFENPGHGNHRVTLELRGVKANRDGIGARIRVVADTPQGERTIHAVTSPGASFGSNSLATEIGLGDATRIAYVEIRWPGSGTLQRLDDLPMDRTFLVEEGKPEPVELPRPPFQLRRRRVAEN